MTLRAQPLLIGTIAMLANGCGLDATAPTRRDAAQNDGASIRASPAVDAPSAPSPSEGKPTSTVLAAVPLLGEPVVRAQWSKAANRRSCAPLALKSDAKAGGTPRPANFSGGWAVAFDQPDRRSAYGFAGSGLTPDDRADFAVLVDRLTRQWPYVRRWDAGDTLPTGSAVGYGLEGAKDYPSGSSGYGLQSLAYLRIPGQACLYNVWSKLGRDHLELLLSELVLLEP